MKIFLSNILLFFCLLATSQNKISTGEYWFDFENQERISLSFSPDTDISLSTDIDIQSLCDGLHCFHLRFMDDSSRWSPVSSAFFVKASNENNQESSEISAWEAWFDYDLENRQYTDIPNTKSYLMDNMLDVSQLDQGLHCLHIRFCDSQGKWSPALSTYFIIKETETGSELIGISAYELWFDNRLEDAVYTDIENTIGFSLSENLDISSLERGLHSFHFRLMDSGGKWSSTVSNFFVKLPDNADQSDNMIHSIEYWVDNNADERKTSVTEELKDFQFIEQIDFSDLKSGLHCFHLRFRDTRGNYSPALSRYFVIPYADQQTADNKITGYRYWLNDSETPYTTLDESIENLVFIDSIDMRMFPKGEYVLHFQFRDLAGKWSSATSDTLQKISFPWAQLSSDRLSACMNDSVQLQSLLIDADSISWDLGDGTNSGQPDLKYAWNEEGTYSVTARVFDREAEKSADFSLENDVIIHALPVIDLGEDIDLCEGEEKLISGPEGMTAYRWSTESEETSLVIKSSGRYWLVVEDVNACQNSDSLDVVVHALPVVNIGDSIAILETESYTADAGAGFESYFWNDTEGNQTYVLEGNELGPGEHRLEITVSNEFGCSASDTLFISVASVAGVGDNLSSILKLYPNPMQDVLNLEWNNIRDEEIILHIVDATGRPVHSSIIEDNKQEISVNTLSPGNYFVIIKTGGKIYTRSLIKL